jgi:hypothetical protein
MDATLRLASSNIYSRLCHLTGALLELEHQEDKPELRSRLREFVETEIPAQMGKRRLLGNPLPSEVSFLAFSDVACDIRAEVRRGQVFIQHKMEYWKKKVERWRRRPGGEKLDIVDVVKLSPAHGPSY